MKVKNYVELIGKIFTSVKNIDNEELVFKMGNGDTYRFYHQGDCCETVMIEDICGDLNDLVGSPILMAEEVIHKDESPKGVKRPEIDNFEYYSFTWTFYKFSTVKGSVTVRWYGQSNGFYSESVDFEKVLIGAQK